jgi:hypothetical protein
MGQLPYNNAEHVSPRYLFLFSLIAFVVFSMATGLVEAGAQTNPLGTGIANDPANHSFGATDPVISSMQATDNLRGHLLEKQHRLQPDSNLRQLRAKRPEPGESEVTRQEESMPLRDPLRSTLQNVLPRDR